MEEDEIEQVADATNPVEAKVDETATIVSEIMGKFRRAKDARFVDEQRWLRAYRNYRGVYGPDVQFTTTEKSRVFVKVTKTKTLAAYGQLIDVLFGGGRFPLGISPTSKPDGVAEAVHWDTQAPPSASEAPQGGGKQLQPGDTMQKLRERLGPLSERLKPVEGKIKEGPGRTQTSITVHPAQVAAKNMEKLIHDQLEESRASKHLRNTTFECALFGTGLLKGPFVVDKEYPRWGEDGNYDPIKKTIPKVSSVSIWNSYPDPDADNMDEAEFFIERHKMSRSELRKLKSRPNFRKDSIDECLAYGENYVEEWWEQHLEEEQQNHSPERFEVIEYWGYMDSDYLRENGVDLGSLKNEELVNVNAWICGGTLIRLVLNPFTPSYIPYYAVPYEINPYSFFGIGVAENMDDTQTLMNGFMRMAVDNAALSGNVVFEVDKSSLAPGTDLSVYPGKVFERISGAPGQAIFATKFPNTANENMQLFDKARVLADESTGIPSFSHGQTGVTGVGRTSSGISMLMSAANGSVRTVVKNFDDYLLAPLGKALFHFNMQFDYKDTVKKVDQSHIGDLEVKARGTESLMANEVRSQRLMQFLAVVQNPILAPFAKMDYIVSEIAKSMDLDPDLVVNSLADAAIQAEMMAKFQQTIGGPEAGQTPGGPPPVSDTAGGANGNIGIGAAPQPGEQGFSGVPQETV